MLLFFLQPVSLIEGSKEHFLLSYMILEGVQSLRSYKWKLGWLGAVQLKVFFHKDPQWVHQQPSSTHPELISKGDMDEDPFPDSLQVTTPAGTCRAGASPWRAGDRQPGSLPPRDEWLLGAADAGWRGLLREHIYSSKCWEMQGLFFPPSIGGIKFSLIRMQISQALSRHSLGKELIPTLHSPAKDTLP